MCGPKRVIHVHVRQVGEGLRKRRIVGLFFLVEAQILEQDDAAGVGRNHLFGRRTNTIRRKRHRTRQQRGQMIGHRLQAELRCGCAFGSTEMRRQNHRGSGIKRGRNRGHGRPNACVVGDPTLGDGPVEVHAQKHASIRQREVPECLHGIYNPLDAM